MRVHNVPRHIEEQRVIFWNDAVLGVFNDLEKKLSSLLIIQTAEKGQLRIIEHDAKSLFHGRISFPS